MKNNVVWLRRHPCGGAFWIWLSDRSAFVIPCCWSASSADTRRFGRCFGIVAIQGIVWRGLWPARTSGHLWVDGGPRACAVRVSGINLLVYLSACLQLCLAACLALWVYDKPDVMHCTVSQLFYVVLDVYIDGVAPLREEAPSLTRQDLVRGAYIQRMCTGSLLAALLSRCAHSTVPPIDGRWVSASRHVEAQRRSCHQQQHHSRGSRCR
jgi:hypothetical protein